jgi:hypothetical protein
MRPGCLLVGAVIQGVRQNRFAGIAAAVVVLCCGSCATSSEITGPELRILGEPGSVTTSQDDVMTGEHHSVGIAGLCVAGDDSASGENVTVDDVELQEPVGGLRIAGFTIRPNPADTGGQVFGEQPVSIEESGIPDSHHVTAPCPADGVAGPTDEIILDYVREGSRTGDSTGVRIAWSANGRRGHISFGFRQVLCAAGDTTNEHCT